MGEKTTQQPVSRETASPEFLEFCRLFEPEGWKFLDPIQHARVQAAAIHQPVLYRQYQTARAVYVAALREAWLAYLAWLDEGGVQ